MNIPQMMQRLDASFPFGSPEAIRAATADYRTALEHCEGNRLQTAWETTIAQWRRGQRPLPADILANAPREPRAGVNWKQIAAEAGPIEGAIVEQWWMDNASWVGEFLVEFAHDDREERLGPMTSRNWKEHLALGATDRIVARGHLADMVRERAKTEAHRRAQGLPAHDVEITEGDVKRIRGRMESQIVGRPVRGFQRLGTIDPAGLPPLVARGAADEAGAEKWGLDGGERE